MTFIIQSFSTQKHFFTTDKSCFAWGIIKNEMINLKIRIPGVPNEKSTPGYSRNVVRQYVKRRRRTPRKTTDPLDILYRHGKDP